MFSSENNNLLKEFLNSNEINLSIPSSYYLGNDIDEVDSVNTAIHKFREEIENTSYNLLWVKEMNFDNDWNLLLLVVDKIEELGYEVTIRNNYCGIAHNSDNSTELIYYNETQDSKMIATYNACVEFVKWFNDKNKFIFNNGDLTNDIEKIKSFDAPITISMSKEPTFDYPFALDVEDTSYWYVNEEDCIADYYKLREVCPNFTFV